MHSLIDILKSWSQNNDNRTKLQQAYLASALILLLIAGMIGLVNYEFGQQILLLALIAGAIYIVNAVAWALLQSFILLHLDNAVTSQETPEEEIEVEGTLEPEEEKKPATKPKKTISSSTKTSKKTTVTKNR